MKKQEDKLDKYAPNYQELLLEKKLYSLTYLKFYDLIENNIL